MLFDSGTGQHLPVIFRRFRYPGQGNGASQAPALRVWQQHDHGSRKLEQKSRWNHIFTGCGAFHEDARG
jgi:hypothetical protein